MVRKIIKKASVNKRTKQLSVIIPKKEIKKLNPTIKFGKDLFVKLEVFNKRKKR